LALSNDVLHRPPASIRARAIFVVVGKIATRESPALRSCIAPKIVLAG
jgi:hypothetical protein